MQRTGDDHDPLIFLLPIADHGTGSASDRSPFDRTRDTVCHQTHTGTDHRTFLGIVFRLLLVSVVSGQGSCTAAHDGAPRRALDAVSRNQSDPCERSEKGALGMRRNFRSATRLS